MNPSVVSGMDTTPVFELSEHVVDTWALAAEQNVVGDEHFAVGD